MSVSPALQALTISIRNGGVAKCELLAHWDFDTYSGLPGSTDFVEGVVAVVEMKPIPEAQFIDGAVAVVELKPIPEAQYVEGLVSVVELTGGSYEA